MGGAWLLPLSPPQSWRARPPALFMRESATLGCSAPEGLLVDAEGAPVAAALAPALSPRCLELTRPRLFTDRVRDLRVVSPQVCSAMRRARSKAAAAPARSPRAVEHGPEVVHANRDVWGVQARRPLSSMRGARARTLSGRRRNSARSCSKRHRPHSARDRCLFLAPRSRFGASPPRRMRAAAVSAAGAQVSGASLVEIGKPAFTTRTGRLDAGAVRLALVRSGPVSRPGRGGVPRTPPPPRFDEASCGAGLPSAFCREGDRIACCWRPSRRAGRPAPMTMSRRGISSGARKAAGLRQRRPRRARLALEVLEGQRPAVVATVSGYSALGGRPRLQAVSSLRSLKSVEVVASHARPFSSLMRLRRGLLWSREREKP